MHTPDSSKPRAPKRRIKSDTKRTASADAPRRRKRATRRTPRRKPFPLALAAASALGVGVFVGLSVWVAFSSPTKQVAVAQVESSASEVTREQKPTTAPKKRTRKTRSQADMTLRLARKLHAAGKTEAALEIIAEYSLAHGELPASIRSLQTELEADRKTAEPQRAPRAQAPRELALAPVVDEDSDEFEVVSDDDDAVEWPKEANEAEPASEPVAATPEPRRSQPADEEDEAEDEVEDDDGFAVDRTSPVAEAMRELITVPHTLRKNAELTVNYPLQTTGELQDFAARGFDKFDVVTAYRGNGAYSEPVLGLECGVSSQRLARMQHTVKISEQFEVEMRLWVNAGTSSSKMVFLIGDKVGVSWGQQIVKVSKRGNLKPLAGRIERLAFRGERFVRVKISVQDNVLVVRCDGRETARKTFKPGELQGKFGLLAKGLRMQLTELRINGIVDTSAL